jgi:hypothetical protein
MKIGFANEIANICERVGADGTQVLTGIGLDSRIGLEFLNAGIGWAAVVSARISSRCCTLIPSMGIKRDRWKRLWLLTAPNGSS